MNKRMIVWLLGALLLIESGLMLLPLVTALLYRERTGLYFLYTILGAAAAGGLMMLVTRPKSSTRTGTTSTYATGISRRTRLSSFSSIHPGGVTRPEPRDLVKSSGVMWSNSPRRRPAS